MCVLSSTSHRRNQYIRYISFTLFRGPAVSKRQVVVCTRLLRVIRSIIVAKRLNVTYRQVEKKPNSVLVTQPISKNRVPLFFKLNPEKTPTCSHLNRA
ncbi:hypothetical protein TcasGA2_TC013554 [Tribolium castaneum]|uniref:Uncharacterized protein n=1 Tax=Tribolium castaneum TaxID=7070 RepID=D6WKX0_TRICA|nr:hypothetical protein TcasGA2_TC013554 [Tribolium castaneum]